ncbi:MAG: nucleotide sugar dehydrogenase [Promethearchaeota archaeon]
MSTFSLPEKTITVVGLGYVGLPLACKFAEVGFQVTGIDIDTHKLELISKGKSPIEGNEPGLAELVKTVVSNGGLKVTTDYKVIQNSDVIIIAVQTPFDTQRKEPFYHALVSASEDVAKHLKTGSLLVVESTVAPTTMKNIVLPILEQNSGLKAGKDFNLASCPERVMPGKLLSNLVTMNRIIGGHTPDCGERAKKLYKTIVKGEIDVVDSTTAELVKTVENAYRDVQIAFANEIALLCEHIGVDVYKVRELVNKVPNRYMHYPGSGVGGHCIPKDSWLLIYGTKGSYQPKLLVTARDVNEHMPHHLAELVFEAFKRVDKPIVGAKVAVLGLAYLPDSDDTRNSPTYPLTDTLLLRGAQVFIHDPFVKKDDAISKKAQLGQNLEETLQNADALVISTLHSEYQQLSPETIKKYLNDPPIIVDGRNLFEEPLDSWKIIYFGIGK